jgi:dihydrofolate synthase / folylpolyglutamate synthase
VATPVPDLQSALSRLDARIDWERADRGALRQDLGPIEALLSSLGHPERAGQVVHVGGTKGKGSVSALIGAALTAQGSRVGVYASPHVERVTERVRVDGAEVEDPALAAALIAALDVVEDPGAGAAGAATWFDLLTAAAFAVFAEQATDWNVFEVGLGGRLDSTNVVRPRVCVLTSIALEHTDVLGSTLAEIAAEKAGILKSETPLVCGVDPDGEAGLVIAARGAELGIPVRWIEPGDTLSETNLRLAEAALEVLGLDGSRVRESAVRGAAALPGRMERASLGTVPVVLDGAHVASSLSAVLRDLAWDPAINGRAVGVLALGRDKDARGLLKALTEGVDRVHCTSVGARQWSAEDLAALAVDQGLDAVADGSPEGAVAAAAADAGPGGWVLVTGSLHLVGAVRGGLTTSTAVRTPGCSPSAQTSSSPTRS